MRGWLVVLANRWDSLGARLTPIIGAIATAAALGAEFRFVWPRRPETIDYPATRFFSSGFCARHEVEDGVLDRLPRLELGEVFGLPLEVAIDMVRRLEHDSVVVLTDPYGSQGFSDEEPEARRARFRVAFAGLELSDEATAIRKAIASTVEGYHAALHVRYGDIVSGAWSQFVPREKFRPRAFIERAIAEYGSQDSGGVVAVSDSPELIDRLRERVSAVSGVGDLWAGYRSLSGPPRDWADLYTLSRAEQILAPSHSSFSTFAAQAGGADLIDVIDVVPVRDRFTTLRSAIDRTDDQTSPFFRRLRAREMCYLLDADTGELGVSDRLQIARAASTEDPGYVGAQAREAAAWLAAGDVHMGTAAGERAARLAEKSTVHDDPRVEAYVSLLAARVVELACGAAHVDRDLAKQTLRDICSGIAGLQPYQSQFVDIVRAAEHLRLAFELALAPDAAKPMLPRVRRMRRSLAMLTPAGVEGHLPMPVWQGLVFDPNLALLERVSFWLTTQMARVALGRRPDSRGSVSFSVRPLRASSNGVPWVEVELTPVAARRGIVVIGPSSAVGSVGVPAFAAPAAGTDVFWLPLPGDLEVDPKDPSGVQRVVGGASLRVWEIG